MEVVEHADRTTLEELVEQAATPGTTVSTDEWSGYDHLPELNRNHSTVCHTPGQREWARDDDGDGDGIREVHNNTMEGIWTGVRNFLRVFRGVSKHYIDQYIGIFEWGYNIEEVTEEFLRALLGIKVATNLAT